MKTKLIFILFFIQCLAVNAEEVIYYCSKSNVSGDAWQVYKKNLTTGITSTITNDPTYNYWKVELSPNYQELLILRSPVSSLPDQENYENCDIIKSNADGSNQQVIVADGQYGWFAFGNPHWHPNGNRILMLAQTTNSSTPWNLYTIDPFGNNPKQLTTQFSIDPNWSPSGDKIAFVGITGTTALDLEVYIADYNYLLNELSNITQLTADTTRDHDPCFSPDGTLIAFAAYNADITDGDIVTITTTGANRTILLNDNGVHGGVLNWGTDGKLYHDNIYPFVTNWMAGRYNAITNTQEILLSSTNFHYLHPYYANLDYVNNLINLTELEQQIYAYPNPSSQRITLTIPSKSQDYTIEIYSLFGQQIFKTTDQSVIDISNYENGIYILTLTQKGKIWTTKIQKQ